MREQKGKNSAISSAKVRLRIHVPEAHSGMQLTLSKEQIRHLKVLRILPNEAIHIFDGQGRQYMARPSEKVSTYNIGEEITGTGTYPHTPITIATGVPKGDRMDVLVEKVSELGVGTIIPTIFERSIVEPRGSKIERLQRICVEAAAQSKRNIVPTIRSPMKFADVLALSHEYQQKLLCHVQGQPIATLNKVSGPLLIVVGPEGDLTEGEIMSARTAGFTLVRLSATTLRVETAAIAALAQVIGQLEHQFVLARTCQ